MIELVYQHLIFKTTSFTYTLNFIAEKLLEEGNTKEDVDDPFMKQLMEQLYFKGVK